MPKIQILSVCIKSDAPWQSKSTKRKGHHPYSRSFGRDPIVLQNRLAYEWPMLLPVVYVTALLVAVLLVNTWSTLWSAAVRPGGKGYFMREPLGALNCVVLNWAPAHRNWSLSKDRGIQSSTIPPFIMTVCPARDWDIKAPTRTKTWPRNNLTCNEICLGFHQIGDPTGDGIRLGDRRTIAGIQCSVHWKREIMPR
ncbi:hypothetical protein POSPLADRAFT_1048246 [Postia placenta MAD-698-R-SB12]|uniref:Uncharacterized protein n=1 Tax=Postia placenta MAD-698-R-SB12 TaxID=670580 RepID=A0A1X6MU41_9APHY|nr:hypothetical protein POSPLADRAFT_1048246 [Postia placenta MAD-698-R-SB12]OSX59770.1 hypothetical protein POSPLADRAFT_1048246 [Postia placenta MAD-698-R-SB12]